MKTALTILFLISCVVLIILVLMQEGKEAGLGSLTGSTTSAHIGAKQRPFQRRNIIKATTLFTVIFFVTAALLCSRFL
ncbi:preprotein translocase subunit SecG [Anaerostipes caccae]|uniref:preprotein translocase subunit SecG n=1 Tax=Anaerostipes caccae TaxID=105841 RepID=UPI003992F94C